MYKTWFNIISLFTVIMVALGTIQPVAASNGNMGSSPHSQAPNKPALASALGSGIYDDTNGGWVYSSNWTVVNANNAFQGGYHVSKTLNDSASFTFSGRRFKLSYEADTGYGSLKIAVDGVEVGTIKEANRDLVWQKTWTSPDFSAKTHTVVFVQASGASANIDAIRIIGDAAATPTTAPATPTTAPATSTKAATPTTAPATPTRAATPTTAPATSTMAATPTTAPATPTMAATPTKAATPTTAPATSTMAATPTTAPATSTKAATPTTALATSTMAATPTTAPATSTAPAANTHYISSTSGSDTNPGTQAQPWKTIKEVNSVVSSFKPGDSVLFKRGDTWLLNSGGEAGSLVVTASGIAFGAYGSGNDPVFDGSAMTDSGTMSLGEIVIGSVSNVVVQNLELKNAIKQQISIGAKSATSNHITVQNCIIHDNRTTDFTLVYVENDVAVGTVNNITIANNLIYNSAWNAIRITGGVTTVSIYGNTIHDFAHDGIDTLPSSNNNNGGVIYGNTIYNIGTTAGGEGMYLPAVSNFEIYNNSVNNATLVGPSDGIKVAAKSGFAEDHINVHNNVVWNISVSNSNTYALWFDTCNTCQASNNTVYGNYQNSLEFRQYVIYSFKQSRLC